MYDLLEFYALISGITLIISGILQRDVNFAESHIKVCTVLLGFCGIGIYIASKMKWF
jgi:hypothetical protein